LQNRYRVVDSRHPPTERRFERMPKSHRAMLKRQYHAALAMLRDAFERCPETLWYDDRPVNAFWQIAYHALYFAHLYMQPDLASFRAWEGEQSDVQYPDGIPGKPDPGSPLPLIANPYTKDQVLAYWAVCDEMVDPAVDALDLARDDSGFYWYDMPKFEH